jgi:cytoskeletal protein CcmA (bactofilin family)
VSDGLTTYTETIENQTPVSGQATMSCANANKFLVLLAGAAIAAGSASSGVHAAQGEGALMTAVPGQEGVPQEGQDPEEFRLTQRERVGQDGQRVRVGDTQMIFNSIFDFTDSVNDLFIWAWMPTISGDIADNAFLGAQKVEITPDAQVGGDLFIFAQTGLVRGSVGGDIYAFVAEMDITEGAVVGGAMYGSSGTLTITGEVGGPLSYAAGVATINGRVRGDVRLEAGELELGPNAVIEGELRYESAREATIDPGARVEGEIRYFAPRDEGDEGRASPAASSSSFSVWAILWDAWWLLSSFLVGAIALALGGQSARQPAARLLEQPALGLGFGFVIAVVIPAAAILAMVLLVTIPLGLISIAVYLAAAYLARLVAAQAIGDSLLHLLRSGRETSAYASLAVGLVLFWLLTQIPYVGFLIWLAAVVAGLGGMFLATRKPPAEPAHEPLVPSAS